jgi:hypothetical protein
LPATEAVVGPTMPIVGSFAAEERDKFASPHASSFWAEVHKLAIWKG